MRSLENKVIVVAGAAGGIGSAKTRQLAHHGAKVVLASRTNQALALLLAEMRTISPESKAFEGNLYRKYTWLGLVDFVLQTYHRLDGLINCTGMLNPRDMVDLTSDEIDSEIRTNVESLIFGVQAVLPLMRQQRD
jgi:NADP-dependent 3-hydroxy acid dehydrogenase YdfG